MDCKNDCDILRPLTRQYRLDKWNLIKTCYNNSVEIGRELNHLINTSILQLKI